MCDRRLFKIDNYGKLVDFYGKNSEMDELVVPDDVTAIGSEVFRGSRFRRISFSGDVTSIGKGAFMSCCRLESIEIPEGVKFIEPYTFYECSQLRTVDIPYGVESIREYAFANDFVLDCLKIPRSVSAIDSRAFLSSALFHGIAVNYRNATYESSDGNLYTKGRETLAWVKPSIRQMDIPQGVTTIGDYAFYAGNVNSVTIPNGVTSIGDYSFYNCGNLASVVMPVSVTDIGVSAFQGCKSLMRIYYLGTERMWSKIAIDIRNDPLEGYATYFYSKDRPVVRHGRWWHYVDGRPTVW